MKARIAISFFLVGMVSGVFLWESLLKDKTDENFNNEKVEEIVTGQESQQDYDNEYQNQIASLEAEVKALTEKLSIAQKESAKIEQTVKHNNLRKIKILTQDVLMEAGIDEVSAQEIIRRKSEYEYKLLDLRDRAAREGFSGTLRFRKELNSLKNINESIREDLGDDVFERYLYASEKTNQVKVSSIMQNSPAEYAGIKKGDVIISYDGERIFSWRDLNRSTAKGEREDLVIIDVKREEGIFNILVPRGPLGVKLEINRVLP